LQRKAWQVTVVAFRHVLLATDFAPCSEAALAHAVDLARRYAAALTAVHAFELPYGYAELFVGELMTELQRSADAKMARLVESVRQELPRATGIVRCGAPWEQILDVARERGADLIVLGSHGRTGLPRVLRGSVAEKVARLAPVSVLTVHGFPAGSPEARPLRPLDVQSR
jgi:nucleotide-binding universal stress UspA family protein